MKRIMKLYGNSPESNATNPVYNFSRITEMNIMQSIVNNIHFCNERKKPFFSL